ncbi:hypothetical protein BDB01DRAFT_849455 [Pilobolus umbonatus]|nr:hypothetical protein BDB01DRAFT_849455 [Pilobolus umbonatus]
MSIISSITECIPLSNKPVILWIHDPGVVYNHDAVVNPEIFPNFTDGQLLRIYCPRNTQQQQQQQQQSQNKSKEHHEPKKQAETSGQQQQKQHEQQIQHQQQQVQQLLQQHDYKDQQNHSVDLKSHHLETVIVKGHGVDKEILAKQQQLQLSVSKDIADRFNLRSRQEVYVELIDPSAVKLDHIELAFKEQYLGRSDMWRLQQSLKGTCVYVEKKIIFAGAIKATIKRLYAKEQEITSGYITDKTRMVFRSASAKFFLFIQMSKEMWEFDEDGELYFEKAVSNFLPQLFNRWKEESTNHVVSIILFTRIYYEKLIDDPLIIEAEDGRYYKDFYKVIADWETTDDWMTIIGTLKKEQLNFQPNILMRMEDGRKVVSGQISMAYEGNILEAINLSLNPFDKHYVDRDLMRTGLSIILITPGTGKFSVNKKLLRLTNERMTDNGIAMDLICLSSLPLHITPLMYYMDAPIETMETESVSGGPQSNAFGDTTTHRGKPIFTSTSPDKSGNAYASTNQKLNMGYLDPLYRDSNELPTEKYFIVPHWIDSSFYHHEVKHFWNQNQFKTRCKMYELQMMGIMEHDIKGISIPYLSDSNSSKGESQDHVVKSKKSSISLSDNTSLRMTEESKHTNGENYLSKSVNATGSIKKSSLFPPAEMTPIHKSHEKTTIPPEIYDACAFKTNSEPRFNKRLLTAPTKANGNTKSNNASKNSFDVSERPDTNDLSINIAGRYKPNSTWHHPSDQRRIPSIISHSQQMGGKGPFDHTYRKDEKGIDPFKGSPTYNARDDIPRNRSIRRDTPPIDRALLNVDEDEFTVVSSSTVDPVPINNKGLGSRADTYKKIPNHSPRQGMVSGSLPSIHKQSGNSDLMRTSLSGVNQINRSSPHNFNRNNHIKHLLVNPCNPDDNISLHTSHLRRWQHALPKLEQLDGPIVHWKSLATPACLPLTTDYCPSTEELSSLYTHYMYTVSTNENTNLYQTGDRNLSEYKKTENLLIEMISQRLAQGFQIITVDSSGNSSSSKPISKSGFESISSLPSAIKDVTKEISRNDMNRSSPTSLHGPKSKQMSSNNKMAPFNLTTSSTGTATNLINSTHQEDNEKSKWNNMVWWLSMGHQIHHLTFDSSSQNVEVRRYVRIFNYDVHKISYKCAIWPKNMQTYRPKQVIFGYPTLLYAWNYLDHLVAGYQDELIDNLRFWRARFIVIPSKSLPANITFTGALHDNLDEEEKRIALFEAWIQNLRKSKWLAPEEREELQKRRKKEIGFSDLGIKLTTMDPSAYVASEVTKVPVVTKNESKPHNNLLSSIIGQGLTRESKTKEIAAALQDPRGGVKIMDRRWHFRMFNDVFTGTEFVDWIINQIEEITTREQAVQFGNSLMQRKPPLFYSATNRHGFLDGNYYYCIHDEYSTEKKKPKHGISSSSSRKNLANVLSDSLNKEKEVSENGLRQIPSHSSVGSRRVYFEMSKSIIIDADPYKKSSRRETAILHYDTIHNPNNCYHFQLNWLGCTAQLIQELLQNWSRQAERCGLKLVEGSVDQAYEDSENDNPFQCPVPISMAVPPPSVDELSSLSKIEVPAQFYEIALVRHLDFVLDVETDTNFERAKAEGVDLEYSYIKDVYKYDQYIHRSGVSFVQIRPNKQGFYWVNNRLYTNHTPALIANRRQPTSHLSHPDALRLEFEKHCNNKVWLIEFWERTKKHFLKGIHATSTEAWVFENSGAVVEIDAVNSMSVTNASIKVDSNDTGSTVTNESFLICSNGKNSNSSSLVIDNPSNSSSTMSTGVHMSTAAISPQDKNIMEASVSNSTNVNSGNDNV